MNPAQYVLFNTLCRNNVSMLLDEFDKDLKNTSGKCMDIGCGPGDITKNILLPFLGPNVTMIGTDIMEKVIEYANKTYSDKERLKFEVLDIETKNLPDKYISEFDHIFSFHALHWCKDIHQTFRNIYRMLRPDKTMLILVVAHHVSVFEFLETMAQDTRYTVYMGDKNKYVGAFHNSTHEEVKQILENIGFQVHHCSHRNKCEFMNTQKFISMITSQYTFEFLDKMPHDLKEEFMNEFTCRFEKTRIEDYKNRQSDDKLHDDIPFYYTVLVVHAQKRL